MGVRRKAQKGQSTLEDYARLFASKGGKARAAKLTAERRQEIARKAAGARKLTAEERSANARKAALARWSKSERRKGASRA